MMLPDEACLVGIPAGVINGADGVEQTAIGGEGVPGDGNDDTVVRQPEQRSILFVGAAGKQPLGGARHRQALALEMTVQGKGRLAREVEGQAGFGNQIR